MEKDENTNPNNVLDEMTKKLSSNKTKKDDSDIQVEVIFLGEYYNMFTRMMSPVTKRFIEQESSKIMEWAQLDTSLRMVDYTDSRGYTPEVYYDWVSKYPEIKIAHEFALRRIGSRREQGAMTRQFSEGTIHRTLGYYDQIFASETYKLAKLKEDTASNETKLVVIERFPEQHTSNRTPEQVAMEAYKSTRDNRVCGPMKSLPESEMGEL